jgi:hypothetical protein
MTVPSQYRTRLDRSSTFDAPYDTAPAPKYLLHGPSFINTASPLDPYLPNFKSTEYGGVWTTWTGLSPSQAEELCIWENLLRVCLVNRITPLLQYRPHGGPQETLFSRTIYLPSLVTEMVDLYEFHGYDRATAGTMVSYNWFKSAANVYQRVDQYVRLHDCFAPSPVAPFCSDTVAIEFRATSSNSAEVNWHPSCCLSFDSLEIMATPGQYYFLKPRCHTKNASTIVYSTSCNWLAWDKKSAAFFGIVPIQWSTPQSQRGLGLTVTVYAVIIQQIDETVSFKQTIRTGVTIPIQTQQAQLYVGLPDSKHSRISQKFKSLHCEDSCRPVQRRKRLLSLPLVPALSPSAPEDNPGPMSLIVYHNSFDPLSDCNDMDNPMTPG